MERISYEDAKKLKEKLKDVDKSKCNHTRVLKEYMFGTHSDYVCADCGFASTILSEFRKNSSD